MATTPQESTVSREAGSDGEYLSSQLLAILSQQVALARRGKVDEVLELADKIDQLLRQANRKHLEMIWAKGPARGMYDELCFILGAAKCKTAGEMEGVRKGKNSLRAYKNASR